MTKFDRGKIYNIWDKSFTKCYIGSTCEELSQRMASHRMGFKKWLKYGKPYVCVYDLFDEFGIDNCKIFLLESFPCSNRSELLQREGFYQQNNYCINRLVAGRTPEEYREQNKDKIISNKKEYYEKNKDELQQKAREYYHKNPELQRERHRIYYQNNKDIYNEKSKDYAKRNQETTRDYKQQWYKENKDRLSEKITCECGITIQKRVLSQHQKSKMHQQFLKQSNSQE